MGSDAKDYDNDGWVDIFYNNLMDADLGALPERREGAFRLRLARHEASRA